MKKKYQIIALFLACCSVLTTGCNAINQNPDTSAEVSSNAEDANQSEDTTEDATEEPAPDLTARAKKLLAQNPDTVGWLKIDGTEVDNPIVQKLNEAEDAKNTYYLDKDFDGQPFRAGTIFMDYRNVFGYKEKEFSENFVIYGHNMADNTMFGSLRRYRQDLEFYKESPFVELSSNYKDYTYVIFGLVITSGDANDNGDVYSDAMTWKGFPYWNMEELDDKVHFDYYVNTIDSMNMIDNVVDVKYGDQLLTLSTCYSDEDNSRFIIVARQLRDGETKEELLEKIKSGKKDKSNEDNSDSSSESDSQDSESDE